MADLTRLPTPASEHAAYLGFPQLFVFNAATDLPPKTAVAAAARTEAVGAGILSAGRVGIAAMNAGGPAATAEATAVAKAEAKGPPKTRKPPGPDLKNQSVMLAIHQRAAAATLAVEKAEQERREKEEKEKDRKKRAQDGAAEKVAAAVPKCSKDVGKPTLTQGDEHKEKPAKQKKNKTQEQDETGTGTPPTPPEEPVKKEKRSREPDEGESQEEWKRRKKEKKEHKKEKKGKKDKERGAERDRDKSAAEGLPKINIKLSLPKG